MNTQKKIYKTFFSSLFAGITLLTASCIDDFSGMNINPLNPPIIQSDIDDGATDIDLGETIDPTELASLKAGKDGMGLLFRQFSYEGIYNNYQITTNLTHDIYCGYFANNCPGFSELSPNYTYTDNWSAARWNHFYKDRSSEYATMIRTFWYVDRDAYKNAFYIVRIYYAFLASCMTDTYGDMPFSAYIKGLTVPEQVPYNTQEKIYDMIFRILEQAANNIVPGACSFNFGNDDRCYGGDEGKWIRFANTLRLRLALRISNIDPERAEKEAVAAMTHPGGLMESSEDNMRTIPKYAPIALGGQDAGGDENIYALCSFKYTDVCMSKDLELAYKNISSFRDPRLAISWYHPTPKEALEMDIEFEDVDFRGCEIGNASEIKDDAEPYSVLRCNFKNGKVNEDQYWFGYSRESVWLSYAECQFLLAEASLRKWNGAFDSPQNYFEAGIRESLRYYHIPESDINNYIKGLIIYSDPEQNPFITMDKEGMLEQIITQKWLAIFPNGNEGWAEFRRTDYPKLMNPVNMSTVDVPKNKFIKRVRYPQDEIDYNRENIPADINQGSRVWWDIMDTNDDSGKRNTPNNFR